MAPPSVCPTCGIALGNGATCPRCGVATATALPALAETHYPQPSSAVPSSLPGGEAGSDAPSVPLAYPELWGPGLMIEGAFRIEGLLGRGGMGEVWLAHDLRDDRLIAIKSPSLEIVTSARSRRTYIEEGERWVALPRHPNIAAAYEVRELGGLPRILTEYAPGGSLADAMERGEVWELPRALDLAIQIARGMAVAHRSRIIHLDLKPQNVLLMDDGTAKIADFDLAKAGREVERGPTYDPAGPATPGVTSFEARLSISHGVAGTPAYMPPEQWEPTGVVTPATDVYAFGVTLFELVCGRRPFELPAEARRGAPEHKQAILFRMHREDAPPDPRLLRAEIPPALAALIGECLRKRPEERPQDFGTLAERLAGIYGDIAGGPYPRPEPQSGGGAGGGR